MSEVLANTWSLITSSINGIQGPQWTCPTSQPNSTSHLSAGLAKFLQEIYSNGVTVRKEREIIKRQISLIEERLSNQAISTSSISDCLVRSMFCEICGYQVKLAHVFAIKLAQKGNLLEKKIGYLACSIFLKDNDELVLLLINTIIRDLRSSNVIEINMALSIAAQFYLPDVTPLFISIFVEKTKHSKDFIRKKAIMCLEQVLLKNHELVPEHAVSLCTCLCDSDPGVVITALQSISRLIQHILTFNQTLAANLIEAIILIHTQILDGTFPSEYMFHGVCAPFAQIKAISLMRSLLFLTDLKDDVSAILCRTIEQCRSNKENHVISQGIIYECVLTLGCQSSAYMPCVGHLLKSNSLDVKYMGLAAMEVIDTPSNISQLTDAVLACLHHPDNNIKMKTLSLLYVLAYEDNVGTICDKLVYYISQKQLLSNNVGDDDLVRKTVQLTKTFHLVKSIDWRICILMNLLRASSSNRIWIIDEIKSALSDDGVQKEAGLRLRRILSKLCASLFSPSVVSLLLLYIWVISEFREKDENTSQACYAIIQLTSNCFHEAGHIKDVCWLPVLKATISAIFSLCLDTSPIGLDSSVFDFVQKLAHNSKLIEEENKTDVYELTDAASELWLFLQSCQDAEFWDQICQTVDHSKDLTLSYLDSFVVDGIQEGNMIWNYSLHDAATHQELSLAEGTDISPTNDSHISSAFVPEISPSVENNVTNKLDDQMEQLTLDLKESC